MSAIPALRWHRRPMQLSDLDAVMAIEICAYSHPWTRGNFVDSLAAGYEAEIAADDDGMALGYSVAMRSLGETHLLNLTVHPTAQRRGLGRRLLEAVVALAQERGDRMLWLEVRESNRVARRLYRQAGFAEVGVRPGYYPAAGDAREDAVVMQRILESDDALD